MKSQEDVANLMEAIFADCQKTRKDGQKEYAHQDSNALANFERVAERTGVDRKQVLLVYLEKHIDGIHSYVKGHKSQREDVRGRIKDTIVYLVLLWAMVDDDAPPQLSQLPQLTAEEKDYYESLMKSSNMNSLNAKI